MLAGKFISSYLDFHGEEAAYPYGIYVTVEYLFGTKIQLFMRVDALCADDYEGLYP